MYFLDNVNDKTVQETMPLNAIQRKLVIADQRKPSNQRRKQHQNGEDWQTYSDKLSKLSFIGFPIPR